MQPQSIIQKGKDIDEYIKNEIISLSQKSVPFNPNDLISSFSFMKMDPFKNRESLEANIFALLSSIPNIDKQVDILLKEGYIKKLLDNSNRYLLTEKEEKVQDANSLKNYRIKQRRKDNTDKYLRYVGYALPIITAASLFLAILSYFKKTDTYITNEIRIDTSLIKKNVIKLLKNDSSKINKFDSTN